MLVLSILAALVLDGGIVLLRASRERRAGFGAARWIWIWKAPRRIPIRFSAESSFTLAARPRKSVARVLASPRFELWFNGARAGEGAWRPGDGAASFDVTPLLREGENRVSIVADSPDGVGGILFSLTDGAGPPILVSGPDWTVDPPWASTPAARSQPAAVLGPPPRYPWGMP